MIVVTGGAGFIGSAVVWKLNQQGHNNIIIVDELGSDEKWKNLVGLNFVDFIHKDKFIKQIEEGNKYFIDAIIHLGANSSTTEKDAGHLLTNNYQYTKILAKYSLKNKARFIYASSAATYGDGSLGFDDDESNCLKLRPLNMYGYSKSLFDSWALNENAFSSIVGLKYFNVYGPNEYHKGDMRSVVHKAYEQIRDTGKVKLFKSMNKNYKDGEQLRDFIYVKDAIDMTLHFLTHRDKNGLFNVGSGKARTWNDLVNAIFKTMNKPVEIEYIDLPVHLQKKYQYHTEANINKIKNSGFTNDLFPLESGVEDYVKYYLIPEKHLAE
ncbi:MAG: ADP-glyceromanno-heptose 6-epimerase [Ignavibacteriales bacterium CG12_big_fil_rev_8_21_14_0_65_30_8]|nr:MAG: ADP-glyceromanno-heptose 6-epimerase [Ignavibacteriales bacterium CG12_big_fil_rev_8_21_14_0_65_30_8]